jgi:hypothetical protein
MKVAQHGPIQPGVAEISVEIKTDEINETCKPVNEVLTPLGMWLYNKMGFLPDEMVENFINIDSDFIAVKDIEKKLE